MNNVQEFRFEFLQNLPEAFSVHGLGQILTACAEPYYSGRNHEIIICSS